MEWTRRKTLMGMSAAAVGSLTQPANAAAPLLGLFLSGVVLRFGVRLGVKRGIGRAISSRSGGLTAKASRRLGPGSARSARKANEKMEGFQFNNYVKAEVGLTGSLPLQRFFYPVIRDDDTNCCVPFCPQDGSREPVLIEAPSLFMLTQALEQKYFNDIAHDTRQKIAVPLQSFKDDYSAVTSLNDKSAQFYTEKGHCDIDVNSVRRLTNRNQMSFSGSVSFFDRSGRLQFGYPVPPFTLLVASS